MTVGLCILYDLDKSFVKFSLKNKPLRGQMTVQLVLDCHATVCQFSSIIEL